MRVSTFLKTATGKDLRDKIRRREGELKQLPLEIGLPSEDDILDHPGKYGTKMVQALKMLQGIEDAIHKYNAFRVL